jgi:hypothetical protein
MQRLASGILVAAWCVSVFACAMRDRRPDGPYREAEELADALSDEAVACTREHTPAGTGSVVVAAELTNAGQAPVVHDEGSMPGSEALFACVRARVAEKLRSPKASPAPYVRIRVPVPLVTSKVSYAFMRELRR